MIKIETGMYSFGEMFREYRELAGVNLVKCALQVEVNVFRLKQIEDGNNPTPEEKAKLTRFLGALTKKLIVQGRLSSFELPASLFAEMEKL